MRRLALLFCGILSALIVASLTFAERWNDQRVDLASCVLYGAPLLGGWIARKGSITHRAWGIMLFCLPVVAVWSTRILSPPSHDSVWVSRRLAEFCGPPPLVAMGIFLLSFVCALACERLLAANRSHGFAVGAVLLGAVPILLTVPLTLFVAWFVTGWSPGGWSDYRALLKVFLGGLIRVQVRFWYLSVPCVFSVAYGILYLRRARLAAAATRP